ncbi:MAG: response regulator, partial [Bacteroidales bacterium]|nr:response regulator [Bacteroidales bacterium]
IPFVKYLSESFHSLAQEKEISLTVYSEIDELLMDFDANKLSVVISNVLSNAVKFTKPGGKIIVHLNQISDNNHEFFFIKIKDNGQGISEEEINNIFNRFYQVDNSSSRRGEGTGIGLALCKEFVELMNGTIEAKSSSGKGSEFTIQLPINNSAIQTKNIQIHLEPDLSVSASEEGLIEPVSESKSELPLALIIEDNADVAHYLKTCLIGKYQTIHAANGEIGIETAFEEVPDIIICDIMMPVKDGYEVCSTLKSDERTDHIPVILLTAKVAMKDKLTGLSCGADAYLTKPFVKAELLTRLDQLVLLRKKLMQKIDDDNLSKLLKKRAEDPETKFLQKIIKIIHEEISNHSFGSSVHLARKMHLSESQIYRKLKAITGKSTAVFIRSVRLQKAKELIHTTDKTISEIAYEVGFNDPSWFGRAFKEEFGFAPSAMSK